MVLKHGFETHKKLRFKTVSLETWFLKSYKRNSDLKHGFNDVTMIEIEKRAPCLTFAKGQAAQNDRCAMAQSERARHTLGRKLL